MILITVQESVVLGEPLELVLVREDADGNHAPRAAEPVYAGGPHGIVHLSKSITLITEK